MESTTFTVISYLPDWFKKLHDLKSLRLWYIFWCIFTCNLMQILHYIYIILKTDSKSLGCRLGFDRLVILCLCVVLFHQAGVLSVLSLSFTLKPTIPNVFSFWLLLNFCELSKGLPYKIYPIFSAKNIQALRHLFNLSLVAGIHRDAMTHK